MLSRVAESLFWIARYIERAENVARLIDAARRMSALPRDGGTMPSNEWASVLIAAGGRDVFGDAVERATLGTAVDHLVYDLNNPSSVLSCFNHARENGRAVRFALTQECWEALNSAWTDARAHSQRGRQGTPLADLVDWAKQASATFRGAMNGTMLRGDGYEFLQMGVSIERTDSTARLLDVKYHVLLPSVSDVGSGKDHYQWLSLLQAAAAQRAYAFVTRSDISARGVAEFLILNPLFPRAINFNVTRTEQAVRNLADFYGQSTDCQSRVSAFSNWLSAQTIDDIFAHGLHEFLTDVVKGNAEIAGLLGSAYGFAPLVDETATQEQTLGQ
ncbi:MAG: alpha-E domain-containing protein [Pseudomonadota bacterium]